MDGIISDENSFNSSTQTAEVDCDPDLVSFKRSADASNCESNSISCKKKC